jgi:iron complex outermembrane recepter protein
VSPADPFINSTGTFRSGGQFDYRTLTSVTYFEGAWSAGVRHRFLPSIKSANYATDPNTTVRGAGGYGTLDAFGSYEFNEQLTVRAGIDNLLDRDPAVVGINPGVTEAAGSTLPNYYDVLGRRFFVTANITL